MLVVVVCNLKASKFAGVMSAGMVLAVSNADKTSVEVIEPPLSSKPGEKITFEGFESNPDVVLNPKHKVFEKCCVDFGVVDGTVNFKGIVFGAGGGECRVKSLLEGTVS